MVKMIFISGWILFISWYIWLNASLISFEVNNRFLKAAAGTLWQLATIAPWVFS
jgi:hypothetical protein